MTKSSHSKEKQPAGSEILKSITEALQSFKFGLTDKQTKLIIKPCIFQSKRERKKDNSVKTYSTELLKEYF